MSATILGNPPTATETASPADTVKRQTRRNAGWMIRALNASLFPETKWADCGNPLGKQVALKNLAGTNIAQPSGIATCASPWACLSCAAKIRSTRAKEVDHLVKAHLAQGKGVTFLTFTIPHQLQDELDTTLGTIKKAWRSMVSGSAYAGRKQPDGTYRNGFKNDWGIIGNIRALEITDGKAGWHPHLHVLVFHDERLDPEDGTLQQFRAWWANRWANYIRKQLCREVHAERGVDAVPVIDSKGLGVYVSKIHLELTRSDLKTARRKNRTPWQIAADAAATGDTQDMARWAEYCQTTKGSWLLTGLPALRKIYPMPEPELTDEEIAQQEQDGTIIAHIDGTVWRKARRHKQAPLIAQALTAYETGGIKETATILAQTGLDIEITTAHDGLPLITQRRQQ